MNEEGKLAIGNKKNVLIKQDSQYVTYVQIINVSGLTSDEVGYLSKLKDERLIHIQQEAKTFAYNILVFSEGIDEETLKLLEEEQAHCAADNKALKCFIVDFKSKEVRKLFTRPTSDRGLFKSLRAALSEASSTKYDEMSIEEMVASKKKDYQIDYKVKKPMITYGLIAINVLVYLALVLYEKNSGITYGQLIIQYGAKVNSLILEGEYWRFITPIFLHGGFMHVFIN